MPSGLKDECHLVNRDPRGDLWGQMVNSQRGYVPLIFCLKDPGERPGKDQLYKLWDISCIFSLVPEWRIYYTNRFLVHTLISLMRDSYE